MSETITRRQWLLRSGAALGGAVLAGYVGSGCKISPRPADAAGPIRMMFNENPYGPSQIARMAMTEAFSEANLYVGEAEQEMRALIAEQVDLTPEHIIVGAGSREILQVVALASVTNTSEVIAPYPTFEAMNRYAENLGATVHRVPIDDSMLLDLTEMKNKMSRKTHLVYVCNPNNPTGTIVPAAKLRPFCAELATRSLVLVDEAYHELVNNPDYHTMIDLVRDGHNVIVTRTASKVHGLAGLRVGFGIANPEIIERLQHLKTGTMNIIGLRAALASYRDKEYQTFSRTKNLAAKEILYDVLSELNCEYPKSETNFVFFHTGIPIEQFQKEMKGRGFIVGRPFPPYLDWCRLSMAKPEQMYLFADALKNVLT